ncbi:MAG: hypothetical protein PUB12_06230 [[Clostridium] aminophilum]|nr:hypothetical protein [[Clostridium] aminophilum]
MDESGNEYMKKKWWKYAVRTAQVLLAAAVISFAPASDQKVETADHMAPEVFFDGGLPMRAEAAMLDMTAFNDGRITTSKVPRARAGQKIKISMVVHGDESYDIKNLKVTLCTPDESQSIMSDQNLIREKDDEDEEDTYFRYVDSQYPFEADSDTFKEKTIGNIGKGKAKSVTLTYRLRKDLSEGYYQAFFRFESDGDAHVPNWTSGVNIWVSPASEKDKDDEDKSTLDYDFRIGDDQFTPYALYSEVMEFDVNFTNIGQRKAHDVIVDMQVDGDVTKFPFNINEGNYQRRLGDMESGARTSAHYSMAVRDDVMGGFYPIHYQVRWREEENGEYSEPKDLVFYVRVKGKKDDNDLDKDAGEQDRSKARIVVDSFRTEPEEVYAGQPFELHVTMKNASGSISASNIMLNFVPEEVESTPIFTSSSGGSSKVINSLGPNGSSELVLQYTPSPVAAQKSYKMTIKEVYDSPEFKNASAEVSIAIPVKQEPRFTTGTIEVMPDTVSVGNESNVMFGINNTGKVILYNVTACFEGASIETRDAYVGNIKPGETGNVDAMLKGIAPTEDDGKIRIIVSYEDENGEITESEKELTLMVTDPAPEMDFTEMEPEVREDTGSGRKMLAVAALIGAVAAAGIFFWHRNRKKKEAERKRREEEAIDGEDGQDNTSGQ